MYRLLLISLTTAAAVFAQTSVLPPEARLVMSHFKSDGGGGDERLWISRSADGLNWKALNNGNSVWEPPNWAGFYNVVRDPTIVLHNGFYWVAYTSGNYGKGTTFGLIKSADLLNWTFVTLVNAALPGAPDQITWSPIFFENGDGSIHVIVAIGPTGGTLYNPLPDMRVHEMHPLNADWTQWSAPVQLELPDTNNNDCWVWKEGTTYHAAYADFSRGGAVVHATSENLITGWTRDRVLGYPSQEGNIVLPIPGGGYRLYLEVGNGPGNTPSTYRTCDFTQDFSSVTPQVSVTSDVPMRNGKVCSARGTQNFATWQSQHLGALPSAQRSASADPDADGLVNLSEYTFGADPIAFSPERTRAEPYLRTIAGQRYAGIRFPWLRPAGDVVPSAEYLLSSNSWSSAPTDVKIESLTLMSDGTTRVHARATSPIGTESPSLLRTRASLLQAMPASPAPLRQSLRVPKSTRTTKSAARKAHNYG